MNIYMFYIKPSKEFEDSPPTLYAYTDKKKMSEQFKSQRNMDKFIYTKMKFSETEYKNFSRDYSKYQLAYGQFYTKSDMFGKKVPVSVLCTWREEESILFNSDRIWDEYSKYLFDAKCFKAEYLCALETLLFMKLYKFFNKGTEEIDYFYDPYYTSFGPSKEFIYSVLEEQFQVDDLKLFLKYHQDTFK